MLSELLKTRMEKEEEEEEKRLARQRMTRGFVNSHLYISMLMKICETMREHKRINKIFSILRCDS